MQKMDSSPWVLYFKTNYQLKHEKLKILMLSGKMSLIYIRK